MIFTSRIRESRDFYTGTLGFRTTFEADWYVSLCRPGGQELALLDQDHPPVPAAYRKPREGLLLNVEVEVEDVDAEWARPVVRGGSSPSRSCVARSSGRGTSS